MNSTKNALWKDMDAFAGVSDAKKKELFMRSAASTSSLHKLRIVNYNVKSLPTI
jgi:hypothetical protein